MIEDIILKNEGIIYSVINKYINHFDKEDLYQVGVLGLINAYKNYKEDKNTKFSSYAYFYILGEVKKYIRESNTFKVSKELIKVNILVNKAKSMLQQKLFREPTTYELSLYLEIDEDTIIDAISANELVTSLDETTEIDNDYSLYSKVCSYEDGYKEEILDLRNELDSLDPFSKKLIEERYLNEKSQTETSNILGINQVAVSRKEKEILTRLRTRLR